MPWLGGAFVFVFGVPCASMCIPLLRDVCKGSRLLKHVLPWLVLLGFSKEFALLHKPGQEQAVGCHVFLKWALATPIIGECLQWSVCSLDDTR